MLSPDTAEFALMRFTKRFWRI